MPELSAAELQAQREREARRQHRAAQERDRESRRRTKNRATVTHPKYGSIVVPHISNLSAIMCAAEEWGCRWLQIANATVMWHPPESEE